jgi:hypothetical protein
MVPAHLHVVSPAELKECLSGLGSAKRWVRYQNIRVERQLHVPVHLRFDIVVEVSCRRRQSVCSHWQLTRLLEAPNQRWHGQISHAEHRFAIECVSQDRGDDSVQLLKGPDIPRLFV